MFSTIEQLAQHRLTSMNSDGLHMLQGSAALCTRLLFGQAWTVPSALTRQYHRRVLPQTTAMAQVIRLGRHGDK